MQFFLKVLVKTSKKVHVIFNSSRLVLLIYLVVFDMITKTQRLVSIYHQLLSSVVMSYHDILVECRIWQNVEHPHNTTVKTVICGISHPPTPLPLKNEPFEFKDLKS
jgi:hypothetical protein